MYDEVSVKRLHKQKRNDKKSIQSARGSIFDTRKKILLAKELNYISKNDFQELEALALEVNEMLAKLTYAIK